MREILKCRGGRADFVDFADFVHVVHGMHFAALVDFAEMAHFAHEILSFQRKSRISGTNSRFFDEIAHLGHESEFGSDVGSEVGSEVGSVTLVAVSVTPGTSMEFHGFPWISMEFHGSVEGCRATQIRGNK